MAKAKKDFTAINTDRMYDTINKATEEVQEAHEEHEVSDRRTCTPEEKLERQEQMRTSGKKGAGLDRINMGFRPSNYEYIQIMSRVRGQTYTQFVNDIIADHMKRNADMYEQAKAFRKLL